MQDDDLAFPELIQMAYYALHNLFRKYTQEAAIDDWLIVTQALASEEDAQMWQTLLTDALRSASQSGQVLATRPTRLAGDSATLAVLASRSA